MKRNLLSLITDRPVHILNSGESGILEIRDLNTDELLGKIYYNSQAEGLYDPWDNRFQDDLE